MSLTSRFASIPLCRRRRPLVRSRVVLPRATAALAQVERAPDLGMLVDVGVGVAGDGLDGRLDPCRSTTGRRSPIRVPQRCVTLPRFLARGGTWTRRDVQWFSRHVAYPPPGRARA